MHNALWGVAMPHVVSFLLQYATSYNRCCNARYSFGSSTVDEWNILGKELLKLQPILYLISEENKAVVDSLLELCNTTSPFTFSRP